jgi:agmatine/peptidylarginine deiminase
MKHSTKLILAIFVNSIFIGCVQQKSLLNLYPAHIEKKNNYNVRSWLKPNESKGSNQYDFVAEWEIAKGILINYPFDVPDTLLKEVGKNNKIYVLVKDKQGKVEAQKYLHSNNINIDNVIFIKNKKLNINPQNIGFFRVKSKDGVSNISAKFENNDKITRFILNKNEKTIKTKAILNGESFIFDGNRTVYTNLNFMKTNNTPSNKESLRKLFSIDMSIQELIYIPYNADEVKLSNVIRLLDKHRVLLKEVEKKDTNYSKLENLKRITKTFGSYDDTVRVYRFKEYEFQNRYTCYMSSIIFNNKVFVPVYGIATDNVALDRWKELMPNYEIIGCKFNNNQKHWSVDNSLYDRVKVIH